MRKSNTMRRACAALVAIVFLACDDSSSPVDTQPPEPSIHNIWPHQDQRSWTYELVQYLGQPLGVCDSAFCFSTPAEVPPAPSLDDIAALIGNQPLPVDSIRVNGAYRLKFDGERTTDTGFTGQNLTETLYEEGSGLQSLDPVPPALRFLSVLAAARPDLLPAIRSMVPGIEALHAQGSIEPPLFLFGYAWVQTATEIGSYSDVDTVLAWKYLESNLSVGHEYVWQLVRPLANDVFLHARVTAKGTRDTPMGRFSNAIDVLYMVDFGVTEILIDSGGALAYLRWISYGEITYAPEVGPIASRERNLIRVGASGFDRGYSDTTLDLIGTGLPAPPALAWDGARAQ